MLAFTCQVTLVHSQEGSDDPHNPDTFSVRISDDTIIYAPARRMTAEPSAAPELRTVPDTIVDGMKNDPDFRYANDPSTWKKEPPPREPGFIKALDWISRSPIMRWVLYFFLAAIVLFAIYQVMIVNDFFVLSRRKTKQISPEITEEEMNSADIEQHIQKAISNKEYRLATRFMFLKTLNYLHDHQLIQFDAKSTNRDYISQMKKSERGGEFNHLTNIYEYVWYGEYQLSEQQFDVVQQRFHKFVSKN